MHSSSPFVRGIQMADNIIYQTAFDLKEFHNFVQYFKDLIFPSLMLKTLEYDIFCELSLLSFKEILQFQDNKQKTKDFLTKFICDSNDTLTNVPILIQFNLDAILIVHKLSPYSENKLLTDNLKLISTSTQISSKPRAKDTQ